MYLCLLWMSGQSISWSKTVVFYFIQRKYLSLHPLRKRSSVCISNIYVEIQNPNSNDWWKLEYEKKSWFILHSLSVFTWPCSWWLHVFCNLPQAKKESHFVTATNPTVSPLRSVFLISFCFSIISWGLLKTFFCCTHNLVLHFPWCS